MSNNTTEQINIRAAKPADARELAPLIAVAIGELANVLTGADNEQEMLATLAVLIAREGNRLSYQNILVAELEQRIAGLVIMYHGSESQRLDAPIIEELRLVKGDPSLTLDQEADQDEFYIDTLSVAEEFKGRGIGSALIKAVEERGRALGYEKIALLVEPSNERAHHLYERLGYRTDKTVWVSRHAYYHQMKLLNQV